MLCAVATVSPPNQELAKEMQEDIDELKRIMPSRLQHKRQLESDAQRLRIKVRSTHRWPSPLTRRHE